MRRPNTSFCRYWGGAAGLFSFLPRLRRKSCRAVQADFLPGFLLVPDPFCDSCNIVDVLEGSHISQCSSCSLSRKWSGTHPLLVSSWCRSVESAVLQTVVEIESHARHAPSVPCFPCLCQVESFVVCRIMYGSCLAQVNKRLEICLGVPCKSALSVLSLHSYTVSPVVRISSWLVYSDPTLSQSRKGII